MAKFGIIKNPETGEVILIKDDKGAVVEVARASKSNTFDHIERWELYCMVENGFKSQFFKTYEETMRAFADIVRGQVE